MGFEGRMPIAAAYSASASMWSWGPGSPALIERIATCVKPARSYASMSLLPVLGAALVLDERLEPEGIGFPAGVYQVATKSLGGVDQAFPPPGEDEAVPDAGRALAAPAP